MVVLIKRTIRAGQVLCVLDVDNPTQPLAWAFNGPTGWQVKAAGRVVDSGLTQRRAVSLMQRTARALALTTALLEGAR